MESSSLNPAAVTAVTAKPLRDRKGRVYEPAIGPRLRVLLVFIFAAVAVLGATAIYLVSIRGLEEIKGQSYWSLFSLWMFAVHQWLGVLFLLPFFLFGFIHMATARHRKNRRAVRLGLLLFVTGALVCLTGMGLMQLPGLPQLPSGLVRTVILWAHGVLPVAAVAIYVLHRRAGPAIKWKWGYAWGGAVAVFIAAMLYMHSTDPRRWYASGSPEGERYFEPSRARTVDANFIPAHALMNDKYCMKCHEDIYKSHLHSAHRLSSFNNPAYLFSVRETRKRVGVRASRWCAGCHDPVPFFSGQFDDPNFDDVNNPTAHAGITCTTCHSITNVNSRSGNGDYTIEEPIHYPFAYSDNPVLQWLNNQLVKAKPGFHKKTFLKPFHKTEAFCSTCHKVGVPQEVNHYKEFLRGQNHNDSYLLSGVSGSGARSFYYPPKAQANCNGCHMPLLESNDFGAADFDGSGKRKVHNHLFPAANTGLAALKRYAGYEEIVKAHEKFLQNGPDGKSPTLRIDLFGLKDLGPAGSRGVDAALIDDRPLRPNLPKVRPGGTYLVEVVVRTVGMGHHFTQGTADSNEVWVNFQAKAVGKNGTRLLARNGGMEGADEGRVDENAHFINILMLDRHGNRVDRRNPQDIFTPLYNHQIPPGAANVLHYRLRVPPDLKPGVALELSARVRYRKFDYRYMELVHAGQTVPKLPIVNMCADKVVLPVAGVTEAVPAQKSPIEPAWQRWNDYGIGCFLEGGPDGKKDGELGQAERAFQRLVGPEFKDVKAAHAHGWLNLARTHIADGRLELARQDLTRARQTDPPAPWQTVAWFNGLVNVENGNLDEAVKDFETILDPKNRKNGFDFTKDYVVGKELGKTFFRRAQRETGAEAEQDLRRAVARFEEVLKLDAEDVPTHDFLQKCFGLLAGKNTPAPGRPKELSAEANRLLELVKGLEAAPSRFEAARDLNRLLRQEAASWRPGLMVLLEARRRCWSAAAASRDDGLRVALTPILNGLDRHILAALPAPGKELADATAPLAQRLEAAAELTAALAELGVRPPAADVRPTFLALGGFPQPGLPANLALATLAEKGFLHGPLPQPRLLTLQALRLQVRPLFAQDGNGELRTAAAGVLARIHLLMHGIYKPDENAAAYAVRVYRQRHPAAARASQPIVIYPLTPAQAR